MAVNMARILGGGTEFILLTGGGEHGPQVVNTLFGHEGVVRTDAWPRLSGRHLGAGTTLTKDAPPDQLTVTRVRQMSLNWKRPVKQPR